MRDAPIQERIAITDGRVSQVWIKWFDALKRLVLNDDGSFSPATIADADAANNSVYYSSTASKLVYKDSSGTVHALY